MAVYLQEKKMSDCIYRNGYHDRVVMTWFSVARSGPQMVLHAAIANMGKCAHVALLSQVRKITKKRFFGIFAHIQK